MTRIALTTFLQKSNFCLTSRRRLPVTFRHELENQIPPPAHSAPTTQSGQNPETHAPTTYKVEGSLYHQPAREGRWTILTGTATDPEAVLYRLDPGQTGVAMFLLKGDDNVLFFLNQDRRPLVGHAEFSYTLNRKEQPATVP